MEHGPLWRKISKEEFDEGLLAWPVITHVNTASLFFKTAPQRVI